MDKPTEFVYPADVMTHAVGQDTHSHQAERPPQVPQGAAEAMASGASQGGRSAMVMLVVGSWSCW